MKIQREARSVTISVRVTPKASRSGIIGFEDGILKVRLAAPPVDGAANTELVKLLAKSFGVSKSDVELIAGAASRNKVVRLSGLEESSVSALIGRISK